MKKEDTEEYLWSVEEVDQCYYDPDEAIAAFLDDVDAEFWSGTIELHRYKRAEVDMADAGDPLSYVLENLDSVYFYDVYEEPDGPTPAMIEATKEYLAKIKTEYHPWLCLVETEKVDVMGWLRQNKPHWLS